MVWLWRKPRPIAIMAVTDIRAMTACNGLSSTQGEEPPHNIPSLARVGRLGAQAWPVTRLREDGITLTWSAGRPARWTPLILGRGAMGDDTRA